MEYGATVSTERAFIHRKTTLATEGDVTASAVQHIGLAVHARDAFVRDVPDVVGLPWTNGAVRVDQPVHEQVMHVIQINDRGFTIRHGWIWKPIKSGDDDLPILITCASDRDWHSRHVAQKRIPLLVKRGNFYHSGDLNERRVDPFGEIDGKVCHSVRRAEFDEVISSISTNALTHLLMSVQVESLGRDRLREMRRRQFVSFAIGSTQHARAGRRKQTDVANCDMGSRLRFRSLA